MPIKLERYEIAEKLGQGGMAEVFKARDLHMNRFVALKLLRAERCSDQWFRKRFLKEAKAMGQFSHPNIVSVYDVGEVDGRPYIVMELVESDSLEQALDKGRKFSGIELLDIARQLANALQAAHERGVIHRDIKPGNIFWSEHDHSARVSDFGIAHIADIKDTITTQAGELLGTPQYMAPEVLEGNNTDIRSDLYALGVVLYQLASGKRPFDSANLANLVYKISHEEPAPLKSIVNDVPKSLLSIIEKLMNKKPDKRYNTAKDVLTELNNTSASLTRPDENRESSFPVFAVVGGVAVVTLAVLFFFLVPGEKEPDTVAQKEDEIVAPPKAELESGLEQKVTALLPPLECADLKVSVSDLDTVTLKGHVSTEDDLLSVMEAMESEGNIGNLVYDVELKPWPFCQLVELASVAAKKLSGQHSPQLLTEGPLIVKSGDSLDLSFQSSDFGAHIYVDWINGSGKVTHLYPQNSQDDALLAAGTRINLEKMKIVPEMLGSGEQAMLAVYASDQPLRLIDLSDFREEFSYIAGSLNTLQQFAVSLHTIGITD